MSYGRNLVYLLRCLNTALVNTNIRKKCGRVAYFRVFVTASACSNRLDRVRTRFMHALLAHLFYDFRVSRYEKKVNPLSVGKHKQVKFLDMMLYDQLLFKS